jgi:hypothetical protein
MALPHPVVKKTIIYIYILRHANIAGCEIPKSWENPLYNGWYATVMVDDQRVLPCFMLLRRCDFQCDALVSGMLLYWHILCSTSVMMWWIFPHSFHQETGVFPSHLQWSTATPSPFPGDVSPDPARWDSCVPPPEGSGLHWVQNQHRRHGENMVHKPFQYVSTWDKLTSFF